MNRYTFVVQVHAEGIATLENLSTNERVRISELAAIGSQIEEWLSRLPTGDGAPARRSSRPAGPEARSGSATDG